MAASRLTRDQLVERLKSIKLLALDVDGVLTDDTLYVGPNGFEAKKFHVADGFFMVLAQRAGLKIAIVSGRTSPATVTRMQELNIEYVIQGIKNKVLAVEPLLAELNIGFNDVAFIGNDLLDVGIAKRVGLPISVPNASEEYLDLVHYVTTREGGSGAVREILDCYFEAIGRDPKEYIAQ